jgi:hypothetical protein
VNTHTHIHSMHEFVNVDINNKFNISVNISDSGIEYKNEIGSIT